MQKLVIAILVLVFLACSGQGDLRDTGRLSVLVSVVPQQYFVEKIAGDLAEVTVLVPPGASPTTYEISPSDMRRVNRADVWFTIGLQREDTWIPEFSSLNHRLKIASTIDDVTRLSIGRYSIPGEHSEIGNHDRDHDLSGVDPHVWLSPELVSIQARAICTNLIELDSANSGIYSENLTFFLEEISELQIIIHQSIDSFQGESFMVFHPAWGYFADEFSLIQVPIEISGSEPSPSELAQLIDYGRNSSIKVVFVSPQFSETSAETIADELEASVVFIDPLALNWAENLVRVSDQIASAME
ncbi:MAG: zinc ABC transporter substrate-binding protein [Candidatus Sabulitectum sp.]|nr:zinc ABC transporter substrate-binding protein [Candidatus Sabulitectum sp.]